jgi:hypothetical protein
LQGHPIVGRCLIPEHGRSRHLWDDLFHQLQPLTGQLGRLKFRAPDIGHCENVRSEPHISPLYLRMLNNSGQQQVRKPLQMRTAAEPQAASTRSCIFEYFSRKPEIPARLWSESLAAKVLVIPGLERGYVRSSDIFASFV